MCDHVEVGQPRTTWCAMAGICDRAHLVPSECMIVEKSQGRMVVVLVGMMRRLTFVVEMMMVVWPRVWS